MSTEYTRLENFARRVRETKERDFCMDGAPISDPAAWGYEAYWINTEQVLIPYSVARPFNELLGATADKTFYFPKTMTRAEIEEAVPHATVINPWCASFMRCTTCTPCRERCHKS